MSEAYDKFKEWYPKFTAKIAGLMHVNSYDIASIAFLAGYEAAQPQRATDGVVCSCERPHHATSHPDICLSCGKPRH